ncbi:hypothetical protein [Agrococcus sp. ARC_14]|uniref:hypothetical protein n=1 Tax=Agrococcus sp. ARC_14 TaxID=2919927 RepID=UPI001F06FE6F|nr:hypothetical protein [Agrococcus sp. ARC_14]MCH1884196.1 hypothetical protein [Agrococcus sp. ARC_14]
MHLAARRHSSADGGLRGVAAALIEVTMPNGVDTATLRRLRGPLWVAMGASALAAVLAVLAVIDVARLLVGSGAVALVLAIAVLLLPASKLVLGVPSGPAAAIAHAAPLLRAIDLGPALERAGRIAALIAPIGPIAVLGLAGAAVLIARGSSMHGLVVAAATAAGAAAGWLAAIRAARSLRAQEQRPAPLWRVLMQAALLTGVALVVAAGAPLAPAGMHAAVGSAALAAAVAGAVHVAGEILGLDARGPLRLARSLLDCGAAPWRFVALVLGGALGCAAALGMAAATAVGALSGSSALAALGGLSVVSVTVSAVAVLVARPTASDIVPRVLLFAVALVPAGLALAAGSWISLGAAAALACIVLLGLLVSRLS